MKLPFTLVLGAVASLTANTQTIPNQPSFWRDPEFVNKFMGTYGTRSEIEPKINSQEAELFQRVAQSAQSSPQSAISQLRTGLTSESSAALDFTLGNFYLQTGDGAQAIRAFETAIRKFPSFQRAHQNLGLVLVQQGQYAEALEHLTEAASLGAHNDTVYGLIGLSHLNEGRFLSALKAYDLALTLNGKSADWREGRMAALLKMGNQSEARAALKELLEQDASQERFWKLHANTHLAERANEQAIASLEIATRLGDNAVATRKLLGDLYINEGMPELALDHYRAAMENDEITVEAGLRMVDALVRTGALDEGKRLINAFEIAFQGNLAPQQETDLLNYRAQIALSQGEDAEAVEILEQIIAVDPNNGRSLILLANFKVRSGELEDATFLYERAARIDEFRHEALIQHAQLEVQQRDFAEAISLLEQAQNLAPKAYVADYLARLRTAMNSTRN